jgi:hypothetical protein
MKKLILLAGLVFTPLTVLAQQPEKKTIKPPVVKSVPRDFTRPQVKRPSGFGKQQWQQPQQPQVKPSHNWNRGPVIIYNPNPYRYRYVHPHPVYQNWHNFYYPAQPVYPIYPVQPYFFFQFRF